MPTPKELAHINIDKQLTTCDWTIQDMAEFIKCYNPENRNKRKATFSEKIPEGCWRSFPYNDLMACNKVNLDFSWLHFDSISEELGE